MFRYLCPEVTTIRRQLLRMPGVIEKLPILYLVIISTLSQLTYCVYNEFMYNLAMVDGSIQARTG